MSAKTIEKCKNWLIPEKNENENFKIKIQKLIKSIRNRYNVNLN